MNAVKEPQKKLEPARAHHETRVWIRELLAQHGTLPTSRIAAAIGVSMKHTCRKLLDMETARMVKPVGERRVTRLHREHVWALRCHSAASIRMPQNADGDVPPSEPTPKS